ncbi:LysR family transcriptional regulator [Sphingomonas sp. Leaf33]|uniref:LysR family transcriptional regulator n=1 Tax=Sphingomonas sp. Leaf33 TaxID=1736215 RepID=UPI0006FA3FB1|nr:LysR family transcriptional regulator [Sphingomonas sp. Leaf33]KQN26366.1 LysR family transcriptional regulator [Sphingomonas sp. Leaf33]
MNPDYALFATVVDSGSLSAAARALRISPAMVSKRLARLETRLGVRLLHRTTRRLALTPPGERFHADVIAILAAMRTAEERLTGIRDVPSGPLRVSAPTSFGRLHIAPSLHRFLARYPSVDLHVDLTDAAADLFGGRIDLAVRITADVPASVVAHRLAANRRLLCASPTYFATYGTPDDIADLARHRLLAAAGQSPWRLAHGRQRRTVDVASVVETNSSELVRELALSGVGIALRSLWDVGEALADGRLVRVLPDWSGPDDLAIYALHPRAPSVPAAVTAFIDFLRETFDPPPWEAA